MRKIVLILFLSFYLISLAHAQGRLEITGRINFDNLTVGQLYSLRELSGSDYQIGNYIKPGLAIEIEPAIPLKAELISRDVKPLPDISWVKLEKKFFVLKYAEKARADIVLTIPDEPGYLGKKFQFNIRVKAADFPQTAMPLTKVLISISEERISIPHLIAQFEMDKLKFDLIPGRCTISNFPLGQKINLSEFAEKAFELSNNNEQKYVFQITTDAPDFLSLDTGEFILEPHRHKKLYPHLFIPDKAVYRNRKFTFTIEARVVGQTPEQTKSIVITVKTIGE